jgi:hypothetical protein
MAGAVAFIFAGGARRVEEETDEKFSGINSPEPPI